MAGKKTRNTRPIKADETKAERFKRVVSPRITKAVKAIAVIAYCAGTAYEYTPEQVKQIDNALAKAVVSMLHKFEAKASKTDEFTFGE